MSVAQIDLVWKHSKARGSERLVLLAIADCANDQGLAWPSLDRIASKAAIHKTTVIRLERKLERRGELRIERSPGRVSNRYYVTIQPSHEMQPLEPSQSATVATRNGSILSRQQLHPVTPTVAPVLPEPSVEPSEKRTVILSSPRGDERALPDLYKFTCPQMPQWRSLTASRLRKLKTRWHEHPDPTWWLAVFRAVGATPFLHGEKDWRGATLDWLIENDRNAVKVAEGQYADGTAETPEKKAAMDRLMAEVSRA